MLTTFWKLSPAGCSTGLPSISASTAGVMLKMIMRRSVLQFVSLLRCDGVGHGQIRSLKQVERDGLVPGQVFEKALA